MFYVSARKALELEKLYSPTRNPVEDYFTFRDVFLALTSALGTSSWELEHLCSWYQERGSGLPDEAVVRATSAFTEAQLTRPQKEPEDEALTQDSGAAGTRHTQVQWLLAKIGRKFGCRIWIAANDHNKRWNGERLGEQSLDRPLSKVPPAYRPYRNLLFSGCSMPLLTTAVDAVDTIRVLSQWFVLLGEAHLCVYPSAGAIPRCT